MNSFLFAKEIRKSVVTMTSLGSSAHVASCLSIVDILAVLYSDVLSIDPTNPEWELRDRFILSKGHAGAALYATLALKGFFDPELLKTHFQEGSKLSGHVSHKGIPGVELSTGSLGMGLSVAAGIALGAKKKNLTIRAVALLSDGECDEGSTWEAALFASHHHLNNLFAIIDHNKLQSLTTVVETLNLAPFKEKWESFGWYVIEVDGHDHEALKTALKSGHNEKPTCVIAHTTKGKGVSFMENSVGWHYWSPKEHHLKDALNELNA